MLLEFKQFFKGRDIEKFIYGNYSLEKLDSYPHNHSSDADKMLEGRFRGKINYENSNIFTLTFINLIFRK